MSSHEDQTPSKDQGKTSLGWAGYTSQMILCSLCERILKWQDLNLAAGRLRFGALRRIFIADDTYSQSREELSFEGDRH